MTIGEKIKTLCKESRIDQKDLAESIGCTQESMSRWIKGTHKVNVNALVKIAKYFDVSTDYLLGLSDKRNYHGFLAVQGVGRYENATQKLRELPRYINGVKVRRIEKMPTKADTVEVVRCKDCKHHDDFFVGAEDSLLCWKGGTDRVVSAMGYCECGERSEE